MAIPSLGREFEMLVFGHAGYPLVLFPTSMGRYYENKDRGLIDSVAWFIRNGRVRIYCPDSIDALSWFNRHIHPSERARNHALYDDLLMQELLPRIRQETGHERIAVGGCSFGDTMRPTSPSATRKAWPTSFR